MTPELQWQTDPNGVMRAERDGFTYSCYEVFNQPENMGHTTRWRSNVRHNGAFVVALAELFTSEDAKNACQAISTAIEGRAAELNQKIGFLENELCSVTAEIESHKGKTIKQIYDMVYAEATATEGAVTVGAGNRSHTKALEAVASSVHSAQITTLEAKLAAAEERARGLESIARKIIKLYGDEPDANSLTSDERNLLHMARQAFPATRNKCPACLLYMRGNMDGIQTEGSCPDCEALAAHQKEMQ